MTEKQQLDGYVSIIIFSEANLRFAADLTKFIKNWTDENGYTDSIMQNTSTGFEVLARPIN